MGSGSRATPCTCNRRSSTHSVRDIGCRRLREFVAFQQRVVDALILLRAGSHVHDTDWQADYAGNEADIRALISSAESSFGGLDILVNNAGPYFVGDRLQRWEDTLRANLLGAIYGTLHAIEPMKRRSGGAIIYYGSTSAVGHGRKHSATPAYDVAKAALARLATTMNWLSEAYRIRVNCIVPDWVATGEVQNYFDSLTPEQRRAGGVPETLTTLDEIAEAVLRLITDEPLSGRVLVWWSGEPPRMIPQGDPGYAALELF